MKAITQLLVLCPLLALGACSGGGLSVGSLLGNDPAPAPGSVIPTPNDPTSRAFQVGLVSARAVRCGYNFDPARLKASFLASEAGQGAAGEDLLKIEKVYDVAYNGVAKAAAEDPDYCTPEKTKEIKADLARHLAGDYTPSPRKVAAQDPGWFGGGSSDDSKAPVFKPSTANDY